MPIIHGYFKYDQRLCIVRFVVKSSQITRKRTTLNIFSNFESFV